MKRSYRAQGLLLKYGADILSSRGMELEKGFFQHGTVTVYDHSVAVALMCLQLAMLLHIHADRRSLVRGALLHDYFLYYLLRFGFEPGKIYRMALKSFEGVYDEATIHTWLRTFYRRFFAQQFKRSCLPDGPKVGSVTLSPRGDWRMPSDASSRLWLAQIDALRPID